MPRRVPTSTKAQFVFCGLFVLVVVGIVLIGYGSRNIAKAKDEKNALKEIQDTVEEYNAVVETWEAGEHFNFGSLLVSVSDGENAYGLSKVTSERNPVEHSETLEVSGYAPLKYSIDLSDVFGSNVPTSTNVTKLLSLIIFESLSVQSNISMSIILVRRSPRTSDDLNCCLTGTSTCINCVTACNKVSGLWSFSENVCHIIEVLEGDGICLKIQQGTTSPLWEQDTESYGTPGCAYSASSIYSLKNHTRSSISSFGTLEVRSSYDPWLVAQQLTKGSLYFENPTGHSLESVEETQSNGMVMLMLGLVLVIGLCIIPLFICCILFVKDKRSAGSPKPVPKQESKSSNRKEASYPASPLEEPVIHPGTQQEVLSDSPSPQQDSSSAPQPASSSPQQDTPPPQ